MEYAKLTVGEFAAAIAEATPAPASGSAAAVTAALAAALAELTAGVSGDEQAVDEARRLRARLLALADEDAAAYAKFMQTRSAEARSRTVDVPLELAETAALVVRLGEQLERAASGPLAGDAGVAVLLARAAVGAAARLVELNLAGRDDPRGNRARELAAPADFS